MTSTTLFDDAACARATEAVLRQRQAWTVERVKFPDCGTRLSAISNEDGIVFEVQVGAGDELIIVWYRWEN